MAKWVTCQNCHGNGKIQQQTKTGWEERTCPACKGKGKVNAGLI